MPLSEVDTRQSVLNAIAECDRLGTEAFLQKHGFGKPTGYWLVHQGRLYPSKAIAGVARGYARPDLGPMEFSDFSGGHASVRRRLEDLGFTIEKFRHGSTTRTSSRLAPGDVYTRDRLKELFSITDATLNTGVFQPAGTSSIWLFVTEEKPSDRTQYHDRLEGDLLHWQGQTKGRTDPLIIQHLERGLELLVFYRARKYEHQGAGFRYLGEYDYLSHEGSHPTSFILHRAAAADDVPTAWVADEAPFDLSNVQDARERISRTIAQRRGQKAFRDALIRAYGGRCAVSGCGVLDVLEAAHIHPYRGPETNKVANGLLLRTDLHTLFDCHLITVALNDARHTLLVAPTLRDTEYGAMHGRELRRPEQPGCAPSQEALAMHRRTSGL